MSKIKIKFDPDEKQLIVIAGELVLGTIPAYEAENLYQNLKIYLTQNLIQLINLKLNKKFILEQGLHALHANISTLKTK